MKKGTMIQCGRGSDERVTDTKQWVVVTNISNLDGKEIRCVRHIFITGCPFRSLVEEDYYKSYKKLEGDCFHYFSEKEMAMKFAENWR